MAIWISIKNLKKMDMPIGLMILTCVEVVLYVSFAVLLTIANSFINCLPIKYLLISYSHIRTEYYLIKARTTKSQMLSYKVSIKHTNLFLLSAKKEPGKII